VNRSSEELDETPFRPAGASFTIQFPRGWVDTVIQRKPEIPVSITRTGEPWNLNVKVSGVDDEFTYQRGAAWIELEQSELQDVQQRSRSGFSFGGINGRKLVISYTDTSDETAPPVKAVAATYLLRVGDSAYIVTATSTAREFERLEPLFDVCAATLRVDTPDQE